MKKLLLIALLPLVAACNKSPEMDALPAQQSTPAMKTTGNGGPATSSTYQLVSFAVTKSQKPSYPHNIITWTAVGETNISGYDVEASYGNSTSFTAIAFVLSSNNNSSISRTQTAVAGDGTRYYRLKIYHNNNTISYSAIKKMIWNIDIYW